MVMVISRLGRLAASVAASVLLLAACGSSSVDDAGLVSPSGTEVESLPLVDLSQAPVADDPDPSVRAGAVADFLECEFGVWQGGWTSDYGPLGSGAEPDDALRAIVEGGVLGLPAGGLIAVGRDEGRVLYVSEVAGGAKLAVVVADSSSVALDTEDRWAIEAFASCDPAEFDPSTDDQLPMDVWQDANGDRVPISVISSARGPEHCGWESATFLSLGEMGYISDPDGVLGGAGFVAPFDSDAELPADAIDSGYRRGGRSLWLSKDRSIAFIVVDDAVEAWPSSTEQFACG